MMQRFVLAIAVASTWNIGCGATQRQWTPTVDTYGNSRAQYASRDLEECRALAMRVSGYAPDEATSGALTGGLIGAAAGAAIGAAFGSAGTGAAVGAAAGGIGYGTVKGAESEDKFKQAYVNCMRQRGHNVLD